MTYWKHIIIARVLFILVFVAGDMFFSVLLRCSCGGPITTPKSQQCPFGRLSPVLPRCCSCWRRAEAHRLRGTRIAGGVVGGVIGAASYAISWVGALPILIVDHGGLNCCRLGDSDDGGTSLGRLVFRLIRALC